VRNAQEEVSRYAEVAEVLYISREHALALARAELGDFGAIFSELETNPLPASLEITLLPGNRTPEIVRSVAKRVSRYPFVEEVRYGQDWLERVFLLRRIAGAAAFVLGGAFAAVAVLIIGAAVRIAIFARREEISIMRLVGATDGFIRRPFLLEGLITGLLGGVAALGLTYATHRLLSTMVFPLEWLPDAWIASGLAGGALLGVLASGIAVRRHLREV
jgi:cell division transport system permease protein